MSKRKRVLFELDSGDIKYLPDDEIKTILRAADEIINKGGRNMLGKILKGSKDKKLMEHGLDKCPAYGFYCELSLQAITNRIDWMIKKNFLAIEYNDRLPMIVFSEKGWEIERETYVEELFQKITELLEDKDYSFVSQLKDRNRGMILMLIEKIKLSGNSAYIPILKAWREIDYKKVQVELNHAIDYLMKEEAGTVNYS